MDARYYEPTLGRMVSADTVIPHLSNPQSLNRYSYVLNNPIMYNDPTGHEYERGDSGINWGSDNLEFEWSAGDPSEWGDEILVIGTEHDTDVGWPDRDFDPTQVTDTWGMDLTDRVNGAFYNPLDVLRSPLMTRTSENPPPPFPMELDDTCAYADRERFLVLDAYRLLSNSAEARQWFKTHWGTGDVLRGKLK